MNGWYLLKFHTGSIIAYFPYIKCTLNTFTVAQTRGGVTRRGGSGARMNSTQLHWCLCPNGRSWDARRGVWTGIIIIMMMTHSHVRIMQSVDTHGHVFMWEREHGLHALGGRWEEVRVQFVTATMDIYLTGVGSLQWRGGAFENTRVGTLSDGRTGVLRNIWKIRSYGSVCYVWCGCSYLTLGVGSDVFAP